VLLDTHAFIWWNDNDRRLRQSARAFIRDSGNEIFLSVASGWEIGIKYAKGLLRLPEEPRDYVHSRMEADGILRLAIEMAHALQAAALPRLHADPFDRLLIAQSQVERLPILTSDPNIRRYEVEIIW